MCATSTLTNTKKGVNNVTTNAFLFSWDCDGIEGIVPITQYEYIDRENTIRILKEQDVVRSPLSSIIQSMIMRATFNPQRHYEIYAIDCGEEMDEDFWKQQWKDYPQETADLIREKGHKIYSDRAHRDRKIF
jgi:hypothetical protein